MPPSIRLNGPRCLPPWCFASHMCKGSNGCISLTPIAISFRIVVLSMLREKPSLHWRRFNACEANTQDERKMGASALDVCGDTNLSAQDFSLVGPFPSEIGQVSAKVAMAG